MSIQVFGVFQTKKKLKLLKVATKQLYLLAQVSLKQRFDKARCMKITYVLWRLMKIHLKIMFQLY